jgi:hypothetical protein
MIGGGSLSSSWSTDVAEDVGEGWVGRLGVRVLDEGGQGRHDWVEKLDDDEVAEVAGRGPGVAQVGEEPATGQVDNRPSTPRWSRPETTATSGRRRVIEAERDVTVEGHGTPPDGSIASRPR